MKFEMIRSSSLRVMGFKFGAEKLYIVCKMRFGDARMVRTSCRRIYQCVENDGAMTSCIAGEATT